MALAPFFDRVYSAVGPALSVSRESLTSRLREVAVSVECDSASPTGNAWWAAECATNLLARLYPRMCFQGELADRLAELARSINPEVEFCEPQSATVRLFTGTSRSSVDAIFVGSAGWVASVGPNAPSEGAPNPIAAVAAGALGVSEVFRRLFCGRAFRDTFSISLLDYSSSAGADLELEFAELGDVAFVGAGAVGNAGVWALSKVREMRGRMFVVDHEELTLPNLQRYMLGRSHDVAAPKVALVERALHGTGLRLELRQRTLQGFGAEMESMRLPTACVSVDNAAARRAIQALLPRVVINGWTGDRALGASWHVFSRNAACLACLYHPTQPRPSDTELAASALGLDPMLAAALLVTGRGLSSVEVAGIERHLRAKPGQLASWTDRPLRELYSQVVCGAVPLDLEGSSRLEAVPLAHQSAMAGFMMAAELVKRTNPSLSERGQVEPLVAWEDVLRGLPSTWTRPFARERGCICGDAVYQDVYRMKWEERRA